MTENHARVREMLAESGIGGDGSEELFECLAELASYVDDEPPQPSPELAALFGSLPENVVTAPFGHRRSRMFLAGVVAIGAVGAGGTAAAANVLPDGAQTIVAELSEKFLPFELPYPDGTRQPHTVTEDPDPALDPADLARRAEEAANGGTTGTGAEVESPAPTPSSEPTTAPSPSVSATESAAVPSEQSSPSASDAPTTEPTPSTGDASASPDGEKTDDGTATDPTTSPSPSGSSEPSPTANTRNEASEEPSPTGSASPSGSASPVAAPTAAWTDAG